MDSLKKTCVWTSFPTQLFLTIDDVNHQPVIWYSSLQSSVCEQIFAGPAFTSCQGLIDVASLTSACVADICHCSSSTESNHNLMCLCNTLSEFSRQCVHAGGKPNQWRTRELCCKDHFWIKLEQIWEEGQSTKRVHLRIIQYDRFPITEFGNKLNDNL